MIIKTNQKEIDEPINTNFCVADNLYASATIRNPSTVCVWLGVSALIFQLVSLSLSLCLSVCLSALLYFRSLLL